MANKIQIKRGLKTNLPALDVGEPALCTDTKEVFIGNSGGNVALINKEVMDEHLKNYTLQVPYAQAVGSANTYTATLNPALTSYAEGVAIAVKINVANTGASTININGLGAKSIRDPRGNTLPAGKVTAGSIYTLRYNGTNFILQGEGASGNAAASDLLSGKTASTDAGDITGTMANRAGHVTAQSSSVSGTTLRFRPQAGFYDGSIGNSVQLSNANFIAANIRSGVNIFGITGAMPIKPDDYRGSPGGQLLTHGNMTNGGYFGRYTGIVTGNALAAAVGTSIGTSQIYLNNNIDWVKFGYEGKILFIARKPIRRAISWNDLNNIGCVYGTKQVTFDGITYKCRLVRLRDADPGVTNGRDITLLANVRLSIWDNLTDDELHFNQSGDDTGRYSWAQETVEGNSQHCYSFTAPGGGSTVAKNDRGTWFGWRPVLEVV
ncbi:MAG TPA: hypothetical protein DER33_10220 [Syntrophomonas sp.]|jgi:hypothetical protein|nr:hypothetical protein [Syntrophomonas sp.]